MRLALPFLLIMPLAACMEAEPAATDPRQMQETACARVIAAHINRPVTEVAPRWVGASVGIATIETRDGNRLHRCTVDGSGRVLGYTHPRG
ncbi:hypothetical protein FQV27_09835 [Paracoccus aurantiacus]|uniref:Uncharacterized protein n=1 Tax=Paracoccus aurantiacus TaxID=2599412 RepID=A0A5C6S3R1_9RHOB|nr:hypothetical protein [Paracoccus aurantiacus]TXB69250.1 hypothetical protein FQV27_09835 [Paracoccus aurantiacus]